MLGWTLHDMPAVASGLLPQVLQRCCPLHAGLLKAASDTAKSAQKQPAKVAAAVADATPGSSGAKATAADKRAAASVKMRGRKGKQGKSGRSLQEATLELEAPAPVDPHIDGPVFYRSAPLTPHSMVLSLSRLTGSLAIATASRL